MNRRNKLVRFTAVGAGVAALYLSAYMGLLELGVSQMLANTVAFLGAVMVQYLGQTGFTFRARLADPGTMLRFSVMIGAGLVTAQFITGVLGPTIGLATWQGAFVVTLLLPIQNFLVMSAWVFAPRFIHRTNVEAP